MWIILLFTKQKMKKISSLLWGIAIVALTAGSFAFAYTQEQREAYQWAYNYGITTQPNIEAANLNWIVTRQAFSKMVVNYLENVVWIKQTTSNSCKFPDENKITSDLRPYAKKTCAYDIMWSNWSAFNPMNPLTRAQLWTVLSRILRWDEYNNSGKRYYVYHLNMLKENWIMNNTSNPQSHAKRGDVLIMLKRTYEKFGSNVYMNWNKAPTKSTNNSVKTTSNISTDNNSNNTPVVRKTDSNGFSYYDSYLDNPRLSNAMKEMKLRSTYCSNIFCQQVGDDGTYSNQKHYYWNDEEWTMTLIPWVYYISDCAYYDKIYGSNSSSSYYVEDEDDDDDYISAVYDNSSVIYTSKDGTKYYYDDKFLSMLKDTAEKKWESDLADYLKIEAEYFKNWLDQLADLDDEDLLESMWIDVDDIDPDNMTKQEKQELIKKFKSALGKVIDENKSKNNKLLSDLKKVTKNIKNDKFWLKEKYDETKIFMEASNEFLDLYSESILDLIELALMKEDGDEDSEEAMAQAFWLIWIALAYQWTAQEYQAYLEEWAVNTIKLLWGDLNTSNVKHDNWKTENSNSDQKASAAQKRARDVARKTALSQVQSAIVTSQADKWVWPWMNKWATKWISIFDVEEELMYAWMSKVPSDPTWNKEVSWLWNTNIVKWWYAYLVAKRNGVSNWWFVLMSKQEIAWGSNWVVCNNKSWLENWYITTDTDLKDINLCSEVKEWNSCSASKCTYTSDDELRYIVIY